MEPEIALHLITKKYDNLLAESTRDSNGRGKRTGPRRFVIDSSQPTNSAITVITYVLLHQVAICPNRPSFTSI